MPQSTSLNIESDVYNTSEQNTEMSLGSESNNESYNEIFEDYSPPPYQANMDAEENPIDDNFSWILLWIMNYRCRKLSSKREFIGYKMPPYRVPKLISPRMLPGPNEVSLHKINHHLAPIVNELTSLWEGIILNRTYEHQLGKKIRAALIIVSCDIPAARKICRHVSALVSCHRCQKKANYENHQYNFAGMGDMEDWFVARDSNEHLQNALGWRWFNSDVLRKRFVKQTGALQNGL
ncbi:hypothetical protein GLOIN_2v1480991 [Rhizophagus irregularis DAOM 181602=DAOM 197198]|nr:hypothetical protein GLOIN_2v1480991 [Rhizophagus irregularis DAOM 181602=DAOM 197198]